jgi:hypothetical protein
LEAPENLDILTAMENDEAPIPPESDPEGDPFRKLIRSMVIVVVLLVCAAVLLALGQCG